MSLVEVEHQLDIIDVLRGLAAIVNAFQHPREFIFRHFGHSVRHG
jgi:hypothetical protein